MMVQLTSLNLSYWYETSVHGHELLHTSIAPGVCASFVIVKKEASV